MFVQWVRVWCATGALWLTGLEVVAQDYTYTNISGAISITGTTSPYGLGLVGAVSIPSTIEGLPVVNIGNRAFVTNRFLTSVTIPSSVTNIGAEAFYTCEALTNLTLPNGLIGIGAWAFSNCGALTNVTIPNGLTFIGDGMFGRCSRLSNVTISPSVIAIGSEAFLYTALTNIAIPDRVTDIGAAAFFSCTALTNVSIGGSVTNLGAQAFEYCGNLTSVFFKGNAPTTPGQDVFGNTVFGSDAMATVYYLPGTKGWGATLDGAPTKLWNPRALTSDTSFGVQQNRFGFNIAGTPDIPLVVEACTNLAGQSWVPLQSCTLTNGAVYFSDPQWTNFPGRFYRIRSP